MERNAHKILKAQLLALGQAGERRPLCVSSIEFARNQHEFTGDFLENPPWQMLRKKQWALESSCFIFLCLSLAKVRPSALASSLAVGRPAIQYGAFRGWRPRRCQIRNGLATPGTDHTALEHK